MRSTSTRMRLRLADMDAASYGRGNWVGLAIVATAIVIAISDRPSHSMDRDEAPAVTILEPAPTERTLDVRTLVQPETDDARSNHRPRRDI